MTIAEQVTQLKKDFDEVKQAGHDSGFAAGRDYYEQVAGPQAYAQGVADGKEAEYDAFWDRYQDSGKRVYYRYAFHRSYWNDENFKPKYDIVPSQDGQYIFQQCGVTDMKAILEQQGVILDFSNTPSTYYCFATAAVTRLPELNCSKSTNCENMFNGCSYLVSIDKLILSEKSTRLKQMFADCSSLENIIFAGTVAGSIDLHWSPLSKASIVSIIDALSATTSGLTVTLSQIAVEKAFGSTTADEWTALIAIKPNWTISLV